MTDAQQFNLWLGLAVGAIVLVSFFAAKVVSLLLRIARAVEVEPVVTTLESTADDFHDLRNQIEEIEKERTEFLADVMKKATEGAELWKKEIARLDRTIEFNSVRPKRRATPPAPPIHLDPAALKYHCSCGWTGEFADGREGDDGTYCPSCMKEIPK